MKNKSIQNDDNPTTSNGKGTFIVKIEYCQNNTWQGRVTWAEENRRVNFRSTLELMNLMHEAMAKAGSAQQETQKHSAS
ncbi:hypothetical protein [Butyrivibrio sp. VCB2006]|uniref:hypothetical protein n=1 Tax=Butyrivibrio sp. VCB2006 TaxID=1280679 RepID=UPI000492CF31|nr:hypothetical protein [Butyrivibrio sp. VCB2006]